MSAIHSTIQALKNSLVISVQAREDEPLGKPEHILAMALSGLNGGAKALRLEGSDNISFVRKNTKVPIIGLIKNKSVPELERLEKIFITSTFAEAKECAEAGSDIIAIDATDRDRPDGLSLEQIIHKIHNELNKPVWADISTLAEGMQAAEYGADVISTTLFGYTSQTKCDNDHPPDFRLLSSLCEILTCPVVLEGRIWYPEEIKQAFDSGAYAVVVGSAITRPQLITKRFIKAIPN